MKGTGQFLLAIAVGVMILVTALLISALLHFQPDQYRAEDTPEGVVHNYLLALELKDYERAYTYLLASLSGRPATVEQFAADIDELIANIDHPPYNVNWYKDDVSLTVESARVKDDWASVSVRGARAQAGTLFEDGNSSYIFYVSARREDGTWKIEFAEWYWSYCWNDPADPGCR